MLPRLVALAVLLLSLTPAARGQEQQPTIHLRAWGVPTGFAMGPVAEADRMIFDAFCRRYPHISATSPTGLTLPGSYTMDMVPFMQIAGDIAPDVLYVNFRQSNTYIEMKLLHPLDQYVERLAGATLADGSSMSREEYIAALQQAPNWERVASQATPPCWPVIRRRCPHQANCPYRKEWGLEPLDRHEHIWSWPVSPLVMGLQYDKSLFAEHADQGVEMRPPRDWDELMRWAKIMTNPDKNQFGLHVYASYPSWLYLVFLYSAGGRVVEENPETGEWYCVLDSEEAVEATWFYARLFLEKVEYAPGKTVRGVVGASANTSAGEIRYGMRFEYLDDRFLRGAEDQTKGFGPVPVGLTGKRGSEFNAQMLGIFSGIGDNVAQRDAAWAYIEFFDGPEARRIRTQKLVEAGLGEFVRPALLRQFNDSGRYDDILRRIPRSFEEMYDLAIAGGVPEPYGKNCQYVYDEMNKPLGAVLYESDVIRQAIDNNDPETGKAAIREILKRGAEQINRKMLGQVTPEERTKRNIVGWIVVCGVVVVFFFVLRKVFRVFTPEHEQGKGQWQFGKYAMAYLLMAPAVISIGLWMYWPMVQGSVIAFQDYSVLGDSTWVGIQNFADVLWNNEFWFSLKVSLIYAVLFFFFGFWAPIILAFLLTEVPTGKVLFRTIYYLPAVLSGLVVILLWKSFYGPDGLINQVLNLGVAALNTIFGGGFENFSQDWLQHRTFAIFFVLLPTVWAGMGPGCLIYLAALKTVPDDLYEAADIDGAKIRHKVFHVAIPSIRVLIGINFIGAMIGAIRGAGGFVLAMTGGGPPGEAGGATEVIGLKIYYTTFAYLKFGTGAAMGWVLGSMLIGFTVLQLQKLSKVEFRTATKAA